MRHSIDTEITKASYENMDSASSKTEYRPDIDGLRAIAVLLVVFFHAEIPGFRGGFIGVDVFFVISGFLITRLLTSEYIQNHKISLPLFYARRFRRLLPALIIVIVVTMLTWAAVFLGVPDETARFAGSVRASLFGFANLYLRDNTGGYFDGPTSEIPFLHFWSLAVEEQFYFVWPTFLILLLWIGPNKYQKKRLLWGTAIVGIISFIYSVFLISESLTKSAFYMVAPRAWEMVAGGLLGFALDFNYKFIDSLKSPNAIRLICKVLGLLILLGCTLCYSESTQFPGWFAIPPVVGSMLLILAGSGTRNHSPEFLSHPWLVKIGVLSYSWYLWHWPLLALFRIANLGAPLSLEMRTLLVCGSLCLAWLSYQFIEKPTRQNISLRNLKFRWHFFTFVMIAGVLSLFSFELERYEENFTKSRREYKQIAERTELIGNCDNNYRTVNTSACKVSFGILPNNNEVIVLGDSYAHALFPGVAFDAQTKGYDVSLASHYGFHLASNNHLFSADRKTIQDLETYQSAFYDTLKSKIGASHGSKISIILAFRWIGYIGVNPIGFSLKPNFLDVERTTPGSLRIMEQAIRDTLFKFKQMGVYRVLLFLPPPEFRTTSMRCFRTHHNCFISKQEFDKYRKPIVDLLNKFQLEFQNVQTIDPSEVLCGPHECSQFLDFESQRNMPVVYDDNHITAESARIVVQRFSDSLQWLIGRQKK